MHGKFFFFQITQQLQLTTMRVGDSNHNYFHKGDEIMTMSYKTLEKCMQF